ncbi:MAG: hydrogenase maturation nickel metallochaperone HypA, partial [Micromonosporaceae bacterium]|nr:hydrogenase maturation nickel metallochaperone HypA [Micromonosporaceae bacterium]
GVRAVHELSICQAIVDLVREHAGGRPVVSVQVQVGHLRQVVPDALRLGWDAMTRGTPFEGAVLDIEHIPAEIDCCDCRHRAVLEQPFLLCPACGSDLVTVVAGQECHLTSIECEDTRDPVKE